jgi:hypothetical protein
MNHYPRTPLMAPNYLLVDFENIPVIDPAVLKADMKVMLFLGENSKLKADYLNKILKICNGIELIQISGSGHNAVDFHIAYFIGVYSEKEPEASFCILSADTGYDPLIRHLVSKSIKCKRIEGIGIIPKPKVLPKNNKETDVDKIIERMRSHFIKGGEKIKPKTAGKFETFVKSQGKFDGKMVKAIIGKMSTNKLIEINGEEIKYNF